MKLKMCPNRGEKLKKNYSNEKHPKSEVLKKVGELEYGQRVKSDLTN